MAVETYNSKNITSLNLNPKNSKSKRIRNIYNFCNDNRYILVSKIIEENFLEEILQFKILENEKDFTFIKELGVQNLVITIYGNIEFLLENEKITGDFSFDSRLDFKVNNNSEKFCFIFLQIFKEFGIDEKEYQKTVKRKLNNLFQKSLKTKNENKSFKETNQKK